MDNIYRPSIDWNNNPPNQLMHYFTWKENGLTNDCQSLDAMAYRFEESAKLMRKMSEKGFKLQIENGKQLITHENQSIFEEWGFINEDSPYKQLCLSTVKNAS